VSGDLQGFLNTYGYRVCLILPVAMILVIMFFIFFRCKEIFAMGPAYDCAVGKGWYWVMGIFAITATVSLFMLCGGRRGE
jgi:Na+/glutamate symporter